MMTFQDLVMAAKNRRSVVHPVWGRVPASLVINMRGRVIARALPSLTSYEDARKKGDEYGSIIPVQEPTRGPGLLRWLRRRRGR